MTEKNEIIFKYALCDRSGCCIHFLLTTNILYNELKYERPFNFLNITIEAQFNNY